MPRIFIDLTEDESHWNGEIDVQFNDKDGLTGANVSLGIGEHEIVMTISQAITLFDILDGWLNGGPVTTVGAVERRIFEAVKETANDDPHALRAAMKKEPESFARALYHNMKFKGLRFRLSGDQDLMENPAHRRTVFRVVQTLEAGKPEGEAP